MLGSPGLSRSFIRYHTNKLDTHIHRHSSRPAATQICACIDSNTNKQYTDGSTYIHNVVKMCSYTLMHIMQTLKLQIEFPYTNLRVRTESERQAGVPDQHQHASVDLQSRTSLSRWFTGYRAPSASPSVCPSVCSSVCQCRDKMLGLLIPSTADGLNRLYFTAARQYSNTTTCHNSGSHLSLIIFKHVCFGNCVWRVLYGTSLILMLGWLDLSCCGKLYDVVVSTSNNNVFYSQCSSRYCCNLIIRCLILRKTLMSFHTGLQSKKIATNFSFLLNYWIYVLF